MAQCCNMGLSYQTVSNTATKQFVWYQIDVKDLIAYPSATTEMIEDADIDIEALVIDDASMAFAETEAEGFCLVMVFYNHAA